MASTAQQQKFAKFNRSPECAKITEILRILVAEGGLDTSLRGVQWGVTVCPDAITIMRLNSGNRCHADVVDVDGEWYLRLFVVTAMKGGKLDSHLKVTPRTRGRLGFVEVDDSVELRVPLGEASAEMFADERVGKAFRDHLNSGPRKNLPNAAWHNPLLDPLLDG